MVDTPSKFQQRDKETGPQGTKVFRRTDIEQSFADRDRESGEAASRGSSATFIGVNGSAKGKRFPIPPGRSTLGRDKTNDIVVESDTVSLVHARLIEKDGQWRVMNLLSTNGTWVNDKKVSDAVLHDGDSVCFGEAEFLFQQLESPRAVGLGGILRRWFGR